MSHTTREAASAGPRQSLRASDGAAPRRPDASMNLLREVMERPLDPAYAMAARRHSHRRPSVALVALTLVLAVGCGWATTRAVAELRRPQPEVLQARTELENEIRRRTEAVDRLQARVSNLQRLIARAQARALAAEPGPSAAEAQTLAVVSGEVAVVGPGLQLTLADAPRQSEPAVGTDPRDQEDTDQGRVLDHDLQLVVNGLWAAGAEAVAINGQRLTSLSAIRSAGLAILVDYRPLAPPYVVQAVGDPNTLQSGFAQDMAGPYLQSLRTNYGVQADIAAQQQLSLPAASSVTLRSAGVATSPSAEGAAGGSTRSPAPTDATGTTRTDQEVSP